VLDFLTPGGGIALVVDSVEEMFFEDRRRVAEVQKSGKEGAVKLVFSLCTGEVRGDEQRAWNVCGGLIGGPCGNRFCTKPMKDATCLHCGVALHATYKAPLQEGHGYIQSFSDRSNAESAFFEPYVAPGWFLNSISDLAGQALTQEEWIAFLTYLSKEGIMQEADESNDQDLEAEAFEKSNYWCHLPSPQLLKCPKLPFIVARVLNSKSSKNLGTQFKEEDNTMDKVALAFEDLEAPSSE
jgi:hypothetical protein